MTFTRTAAGISLIEVIVAVAAVVILAATLAPIAFSWIDEGRATRSARDVASIGAAMTRFFQDTGKWPGQVEIVEDGKRFLTVGDPATMAFPSLVEGVGIGAAICVEGGSGVVANQTMFAAAVPTAANSVDVLDFLVSPPPSSRYRNWHGPYLTTGPTADPWGTVYVINIIPLFCAEPVTSAAPAGALGYAWILTAGPNRTLQTPFTAQRLDADVDDVGIPLSKRAVQAP